MIFSYITTGTTTQVWTGASKKVHISVNTALTGTITVVDAATGGTGTIAVITNPTVGLQLEYWGLLNGVQIVTSTSCDITVSVDFSRPGT